MFGRVNRRLKELAETDDLTPSQSSVLSRLDSSPRGFAAYEHGYHVTLAINAMTDLSADAHENSLARLFPRLCETGATAEILALLG